MQTQTDNIATVAGMYEALGRGDIEFIIDALSDDVDRATDAALPGAPSYRQRHGKDGVRAFFGFLVILSGPSDPAESVPGSVDR